MAVALAACLAATPARAGFVTATFKDVSPGQVVTITSGTNTQTGWAGVYDFTNASGELTGNFGGFCIDINQAINYGDKPTFTVQDLKDAPVPGQAMGADRANLIRELWGRDYASIWTSSSPNVLAAAFQIDVWELINETEHDQSGNLVLNLTQGSFTVQASSTTLTVGQNWLDQLNGKGPMATDLMALTSNIYQDYVTTVVTPAPPGLVLGGVGAVCLALAAWRRRLSSR